VDVELATYDDRLVAGARSIDVPIVVL